MRRSVALAVLLFGASTSLLADADLLIYTPSRSEPRAWQSGPSSLRLPLEILNFGPDAALPVVTFTIPPSFHIASMEPAAECDVVDDKATCSFMPLAARQRLVLTLTFATDDLQPAIYGSTFSVTSTVTDPVPANNRGVAGYVIYREIAITSIVDSGDGTLRAAIEEANAICGDAIPCKLRGTFAKPVTIALESPLPAITACNADLEAGSDAILGGNVPRRIELDGSRVASGNGFEIRTHCRAREDGLPQGTTIHGFAIGGFPENGVLLAPDDEPSSATHQLLENCIGLDSSAQFLRPNGSRGIESISDASRSRIESNIIAGNARSGIAIWNTADSVIRYNKIGWGRFTTTAFPNGASGLFIGSDHVLAQGNDIAFNAQFGISIAGSVHRAGVGANVVHSNGALAIDWALDGATPNDGDESDGIPNTPRFAARFVPRCFSDDADCWVSTVSGTVTSNHSLGDEFRVLLYTDAGPDARGNPRAVVPFASIPVVVPPGAGTFEAQFSKTFEYTKLLGSSITAQLVIRNRDGEWTSSELSAVVIGR